MVRSRGRIQGEGLATCLDSALFLAAAYEAAGLNSVGTRTVAPGEAQRIEEPFVRDAFERGQVVVPLTGRDMNNRFLTLYRRANRDMQEGGTNTVFLAAGFLRWNQTEGDTRTYRAPLVLVRVKLERRSVQSVFRISHHEDDVRINSILLELFKRDFSLRISELEGESPPQTPTLTLRSGSFLDWETLPQHHRGTIVQFGGLHKSGGSHAQMTNGCSRLGRRNPQLRLRPGFG